MEQQYQYLSIIAGANLKRLIKTANMTQEKAAEKLSYPDDRYIRRYIKNGITKIDEIQRIAKILEVPVFEMFRPLD